MDTDSLLSLIALVVLVILSAYFSATETAFSSLNRIRTRTLAEAGNKRAALVLKLSENYDRLLSTILVGNNIVNIAMATIGTLFFVKLLDDGIGATVSTVVITVVVLIFGEISPKSIAKESPLSFAMFSAPILQVFIVILTPVNFLFAQWKKLLSRLFKPREDGGITDEELLMIVEEAEHDGGLGEQEGELIRNAIEFNDLEAVDILTPRVDVAGIETGTQVEDIARIFAETGYSRLPVYAGSMDKIIGVINQKDFYSAVYGSGASVESIVKPVTFIAPGKKISELLSILQKTKSHIAVVSDEYGGTVGIVTMEDILEELVGEIWDESDEIIEEFALVDERRYMVLGAADPEDFFEFFNVLGATEASSVSGWVMERLECVPQEGDRFAYEGLDIAVSRIEDRRVVEILVETAEQETV